MTNLSPCRGRAVKISKDSLQTQPAQSLPIFMEAEGQKFCTFSMFKYLQGMLYKIRWNPVLDADHFSCFPSKALICVGCSSLDAEGIHSQAAAAREPGHAALHVQGQSSNPLNLD